MEYDFDLDKVVDKIKKRIELRKWNTKFRGDFLIHASKNPYKDAMKKFNFTDLLLGCIVGKATLTDVKKYKSEKEHKNDRNLHLSSSKFGNYGFVLKNARRIKNIPCKGSLGFWNFKKK